MMQIESFSKFQFKQLGNTKIGKYWNLTTFMRVDHYKDITYYLSHYSSKLTPENSFINLNEGRGNQHTQTLYHGYIPNEDAFKQLCEWLNINSYNI